MRRWLRESRNRLRDELREKPAWLLELREIGVFRSMCANVRTRGHEVHVSQKLETFRNSRNSRNHAPSRPAHAQPVAQLEQPHIIIIRSEK
jgi:hypothetical protein